MQRAADILRGLGVAIEEHVLPGDQDVVQHHQEVDLVELVGERIIGGAVAAGKARARDMLHARRAHPHDAADRVIGKLLVGPGADGRLQECLVGIARRGLVFRAADDDAGVGLLDHMHHHVGVLILRRLGAVALRIGVGGDVERIVLDRALDVVGDVVAEARIDLVQDVAAVIERPHLADGLVADAGHDALDVVHHGVAGGPFVVPVLLLARQPVEDGMTLVVFDIGQRRGVFVLVLHVVHAGADIDDRLGGGVAW